MTQTKRLLILTGDHSADMHAAGVARALLQIDPSWTIHGVGASEMRSAGVELIADHTDMNVIGPLGVLAAIPSHRKLARRILQWVTVNRPAVVMLVDYGTFHLWLGPKLRKLGARVIYFIPPQIWASRPWRLRKLRQAADEVLCILPFEEDYYRRHGINARFVGNPLGSRLPPPVSKRELAARHGMDAGKTWIGLFPGSRRMEIRHLLHRQIEAARILDRRFPGRFAFALARAGSLSDEFFDPLFQQATSAPDTPAVQVLRGENHALLSAADLALVASGTVTLEATLYRTPMVIMYRGASPTYLLARLLMTVPHIGIPNLLAGRRIVPELWQNRVTPEEIAELAVQLLETDRHAAVRRELDCVAASLSGRDVFQVVSNSILRLQNA